MSEYNEQCAFFKLVGLNIKKHPELRWLHAIPNASGVGGVQGQILGHRFNNEGRRAGVFDTFFPYPVGEFHGLYIEFKFGKNKLTDEQQDFEFFLWHHKFASGVAYQAIEGIEILEKYTGWKLKK